MTRANSFSDVARLASTKPGTHPTQMQIRPFKRNRSALMNLTGFEDRFLILTTTSVGRFTESLLSSYLEGFGLNGLQKVLQV